MNIDTKFKIEDYEDEMRAIAMALVDLMNKVSIMYYTLGCIEGKNLNKSEDEMIKEKKSAGKGKKKVEKVMHEYKEGKLHSGSKKGPVVKSKKQAVAVALSEARKSGAKIPKKGKR